MIRHHKPRRRRKFTDPDTALDMAQAVKKIRGRRKRRGVSKTASEEEVARVFKGQRFSDKDIALGPRNKGWQVIKSKFEKGPGGVTIEKTTRIRSFGRLKKVAFLDGFLDEIRKQAAAAMVVEPTKKKSSILEKNPFLRIESKRRLVSGKKRTTAVPKAKGLLTGAAQFAMTRKKEAS
jgi:hypothetical protein